MSTGVATPSMCMMTMDVWEQQQLPLRHSTVWIMPLWPLMPLLLVLPERISPLPQLVLSRIQQLILQTMSSGNYLQVLSNPQAALQD